MTRLNVNETGAVPMQARSLDRLVSCKSFLFPDESTDSFFYLSAPFSRATSRPHALQHRQQRQGALRSQCGSPGSSPKPPQT
jgi:hypothetical protein